MKNIQGIQLIMESNEELLPDFFMDFPIFAPAWSLINI